MPTISTRIANLEKKIIHRTGEACTCPVKRFFYTSPDATAAEVAQAHPDNPRYCPVCGGLNPVCDVFQVELNI